MWTVLEIGTFLGMLIVLKIVTLIGMATLPPELTGTNRQAGRQAGKRTYLGIGRPTPPKSTPCHPTYILRPPKNNHNINSYLIATLPAP